MILFGFIIIIYWKIPAETSSESGLNSWFQEGRDKVSIKGIWKRRRHKIVHEVHKYRDKAVAHKLFPGGTTATDYRRRQDRRELIDNMNNFFTRTLPAKKDNSRVGPHEVTLFKRKKELLVCFEAWNLKRTIFAKETEAIEGIIDRCTITASYDLQLSELL